MQKLESLAEISGAWVYVILISGTNTSFRVQRVKVYFFSAVFIVGKLTVSNYGFLPMVI